MFSALSGAFLSPVRFKNSDGRKMKFHSENMVFEFRRKSPPPPPPRTFFDSPMIFFSQHLQKIKDKKPIQLNLTQTRLLFKLLLLVQRLLYRAKCFLAEIKTSRIWVQDQSLSQKVSALFAEKQTLWQPNFEVTECKFRLIGQRYHLKQMVN